MCQPRKTPPPTPYDERVKKAGVVRLVIAWVICVITIGFVTPPASATDEEPPTLVVLTDAIRWTDIQDETVPAVNEWASRSTMTNLIPPNLRVGTCPLDTWLYLNAGGPVEDASISEDPTWCPTPIYAAGSVIPHWASYEQSLREKSDTARFGNFVNAVEESGHSYAVIGPGAGVLLASSQGIIPERYLPAPANNDDFSDLTAAVLTRHDFVFVDAGLPRSENDGILDSARGNLVRLNTMLEQVPPDTRVLVVSTTARTPGSSLQAAFYTNSEEPGGLGYTGGVRQMGVIQFADVPVTLARILDLEPSDYSTGAAMVTRDEVTNCGPADTCYADRLEKLVDISDKSMGIKRARGTFFMTMTSSVIFFFGISILLFSFPVFRFVMMPKPGKLPPWTWAWMFIGLTISALPVASHITTGLIPWWTFSSPRHALPLFSWLVASLLAAGASLLRSRPGLPLLSIAGLTTLLVGIDVATGARVLTDSPMGFNLLAGARFYGLGNETFAVLASSAFMVFTALGWYLTVRYTPKLAAIVVGTLGLGLGAIIALPRFGADFGGVLAYTPSLLLLIFLLLSITLTWRRVLIVGGVTVLVALGVAFLDWLRPAEDRTHVGNFFGSIVNGDVWDVLGRKLEANVRVFMNSSHRTVVLMALILIALVVLGALRSKKIDNTSPWAQVWTSMYGWLVPRDTTDPSISTMIPWLKNGLATTALCAFLAFALNDSGVVLPGMMAITILPGLIATIVDMQRLRGESIEASTDESVLVSQH